MDINPADAAGRGIADGDRVSLFDPTGVSRVARPLDRGGAPGVVNFYHAWPDADANMLIPPDYLNPVRLPGIQVTPL